jgi:transposase
LRPTGRQHVALAACVEAHRELYNAALRERRDGWSHASKTRISCGDQAAQLTCGHTAHANRVTQADFACQRCGHTAPADEHAARNILRAGLAHHAHAA